VGSVLVLLIVPAYAAAAAGLAQLVSRMSNDSRSPDPTANGTQESAH